MTSSIIIVNGPISEIRNKPAKNDASSASSGGGFGNSDSSGATLFVGSLPFGVSEDEVRTFLQENIPNAQKVRVPMDREKMEIKGMAFVELGSDADVTSVINQVSNLQMGGRPLKINESKPRISERPPRGSRGGFRGPIRGENVVVGFRGGSFRDGFGRFGDWVNSTEAAANVAARRREHLLGISTDDEW